MKKSAVFFGGLVALLACGLWAPSVAYAQDDSGFERADYYLCSKLFFEEPQLGEGAMTPGITPAVATRRGKERNCERYGMHLKTDAGLRVLYSPLVYSNPKHQCDGDEGAVKPDNAPDGGANVPIWCAETAKGSDQKDWASGYTIPEKQRVAIPINVDVQADGSDRADAIVDGIEKRLNAHLNDPTMVEIQKVWRHAFSATKLVSRLPAKSDTTQPTVWKNVVGQSILADSASVQIGLLVYGGKACPVYGTATAVEPLGACGLLTEPLTQGLERARGENPQENTVEFELRLFNHSRAIDPTNYDNDAALHIVNDTIRVTLKKPLVVATPAGERAAEPASAGITDKLKDIPVWVWPVVALVVLIGAVGLLGRRRISKILGGRRKSKASSTPPNPSAKKRTKTQDIWARLPDSFCDDVRKLASNESHNTLGIQDWLTFNRRTSLTPEDIPFTQGPDRASPQAKAAKHILQMCPALMKRDDGRLKYRASEIFFAYIHRQDGGDPETIWVQELPKYAQNILTLCGQPQAQGLAEQDTPQGSPQPSETAQEFAEAPAPLGESAPGGLGESPEITEEQPPPRWANQGRQEGADSDGGFSEGSTQEVELAPFDDSRPGTSEAADAMGATEQDPLPVPPDFSSETAPDQSSERFRARLDRDLNTYKSKTNKTIANKTRQIQALQAENLTNITALANANRALQAAEQSAQTAQQSAQTREARLTTERDRAKQEVVALRQAMAQVQSELAAYQSEEKRKEAERLAAEERQKDVMQRPAVNTLARRFEAVAMLPVLRGAIEEFYQASRFDDPAGSTVAGLREGRKVAESLLAEARNHGGVHQDYLRKWQVLIDAARLGEYKYRWFLDGVQAAGSLASYEDAILRAVEARCFESNDAENLGKAFAAWGHVVRPPTTLPDDDGLAMAKTFHTELLEEWIWPMLELLKFMVEALPVEVPDLRPKVRAKRALGGLDEEGSALALCQQLLQALGFKWDPIPLYQRTTGDFLMYDDVQFTGLPWSEIGLGSSHPVDVAAGTVVRVVAPRIIQSPNGCWYREAEIRALQG